MKTKPRQPFLLRKCSQRRVLISKTLTQLFLKPDRPGESQFERQGLEKLYNLQTKISSSDFSKHLNENGVLIMDQ